MTAAPTIYSALQHYRTAGLALMFQYQDREPQKFSHKTRLRMALEEMDEAVAEVKEALKEWL